MTTIRGAIMIRSRKQDCLWVKVTFYCVWFSALQHTVEVLYFFPRLKSKRNILETSLASNKNTLIKVRSTKKPEAFGNNKKQQKKAWLSIKRLQNACFCSSASWLEQQSLALLLFVALASVFTPATTYDLISIMNVPRFFISYFDPAYHLLLHFMMNNVESRAGLWLRSCIVRCC